MVQIINRLASGLVFAIFCLSLSPVHAEVTVFNIVPQLELEDTVLELASHPPQKFKAPVAEALTKLRRSFRKNVVECRDSSKAEASLLKTKAYLQAILSRLATASEVENRMQTDYGVCAEPIEQPTGMFAGLASSPRLTEGLIVVPPRILLKFRNEDELAFVMAHELSHYLLKHEIFFAYMSMTGRSIDELQVNTEREADELAMRLIINAGYDIDKSLYNMKKLRQDDPTHFNGSQLQSTRDIVMVDLKITKRNYVRIPSGPYLPPDVLAEVKASLAEKVSTLYN